MIDSRYQDKPRPAMTRRSFATMVTAVGAAALPVLSAACGAASGTAAPQAGTSTRAKGGTATWMATGDPDRFAIRDGLMPKLLETTGVKGEWIHFSGPGYYDKLLSMMAGDTAPDLFLFAPSYFAEWVHTNRLRNLTPLIKRDRYDLSDFPEKSIQQYTWQGNQHGFPQDFPTRALFYNVELWKRAGLKLPPSSYTFNQSEWNWQTFLEAMRKLTSGDVEQGGVAGWNTTFGWRQYSGWVYTGGGEFFNKDMTECTVTDAKATDALQWVADLMHRYKVSPTRKVTSAQNYDNLFTNGKVAMNESLPGALNRYRAVQGFEFDVTPIPLNGGKQTATGGGSGYGMFAGTKNVDAAWEFFKFIEGPEAQLAHARGGATYPSRLSIQVHPEVMMPGRPPANFKLFVDGQKHVRLDPQVSNWTEIETAIGKELTPLWDGERTAREAAQAIKRAVDPLLKEAVARKPRD
jgi:multiple sugar transport system substrate-binding protein